MGNIINSALISSILLWWTVDNVFSTIFNNLISAVQLVVFIFLFIFFPIIYVGTILPFCFHLMPVKYYVKTTCSKLFPKMFSFSRNDIFSVVCLLHLSSWKPLYFISHSKSVSVDYTFLLNLDFFQALS